MTITEIMVLFLAAQAKEEKPVSFGMAYLDAYNKLTPAQKLEIEIRKQRR